MGRSMGDAGVLVRLICRPRDEVAENPSDSTKRASISGTSASESSDSGTAHYDMSSRPQSAEKKEQRTLS